MYKHLKILPSTILIALATSSCAVENHNNTVTTTSSGLVVNSEDVVFPDVDTSYLDDFPRYDPEKLTHVTEGIDDDTIRQLIGNPHFSEFISNNWNYVFNIRMPYSREYIQCQLQLHFNEDKIVEHYYWSNPQCADIVEASLQQPKPVVAPEPALIKERIKLGTDTLFKFDKWQPDNMLPQGRAELDELANKLRQYQDLGDTRIVITGHTDRKGDDIYNMNLSQLRAQTVRTFLVNKGINTSYMIAVGAGESQPVKQCATNLPRQQEINCLQPNRRVTIDVTVVK